MTMLIAIERLRSAIAIVAEACCYVFVHSTPLVLVFVLSCGQRASVCLSIGRVPLLACWLDQFQIQIQNPRDRDFLEY